MTKKQERARARRRYEKRAATLEQRATTNAQLMRVVAVIGTVGVLVAILALLGSTFSKVDPDAKLLTASGCQAPPSSLGTGADLTLPDKATAAGRTFTADVATNCGTLTFTLDGVKAPQAVASFLQLAKTDYWVNSPCHRLTTGATLKVLQCGDPTGTGSGDPGYGYAVENPPVGGTYTRGTLAMARTSDAKEGNGGQFFIVYGDSTIPDPSGYTVFGEVTSGLDIVDKIAAAGVSPGSSSPDDGVPLAPLSILRVVTTEKKA